MHIPAIIALLAIAVPSLYARTLPPKKSRIERAEIVATEISVMDDTKPRRIDHPGATFVSVHFEDVKLGPNDKLTIRSSKPGGRSWTYTAADVPPSRKFWSIAILGDESGTTALISLENKSSTADYRVNTYTAGLKRDGVVNENQPPAGFLEICGSDDTKEARCYDGEIYTQSKAIARLLINGRSACTGWLVGANGHLLTNEHCVGNATDARNVQIEMMAEGATCATDCNHWFSCPGTIVATRATLVKVSATKDYALLKISSTVPAKYGFLRLRKSGPKLKERVYVPQHPRGSGKRLAVTSTEIVDKPDGFAHANSLAEQACSSVGKTDIGYHADTDPGASGSPVIAHSDHGVVALHHCGGCPNRGIPINTIIPEIRQFLPVSAYTK